MSADGLAAAVAALVALMVVALGWTAIVVRGRVPYSLTIKGLGIVIDVTPCAERCDKALRKTKE